MITDLNPKDSIEILSSNFIGRLAFIDGSAPYVVPMTYYYDTDSKSIISYSSLGHKINAMRKNNEVCLQVDEIDALNNWRSVIVHGTFEELHQIDAKYYLQQFSKGVKDLISRKQDNAPSYLGDFSSRVSMERVPIVYRIINLEVSGKYRLP